MYRKSIRVQRLQRKRERCTAMREAKERNRLAEAATLRDCGGIVTDGCIGSHNIRLLAYPDTPRAVAVVLDGQHRRPRTLRGVLRCIAKMIGAQL